MADLGDMIARLLLDSSQWLSGMKEAEGATTEAATEIEGSLAGIGEGITKLGEGLAELGLAEGIKKFGEACIEASDDMGKLKAAMVALKGDTQNVSDFLDHIHELSATSPFAFPELAESAKRMVMLGASLEQTQETMQAIVETGTALKLTSGQVTGIADAMSKLSQGAEPMRVMRALVSDGIPAWEMLAKEMGTTIPEAMAQVKSGAEGPKQALIDLTQAMAGNADNAAKWGDTWRGAMKGLDTETEAAMRNVGDDIKQALNEYAAPALKEVTALVKDLADWWKNLSQPVKDAILAFGASVAVFSAVGGAIAIVGAVVGALGASFLAPVAAIAVLVAALVGLGEWISQHWAGITNILSNAWEGIEQIWGVTWAEIKAALLLAWDAIASVGKTIWDGYVALYSGIWDALKTAWSAIWTAIKTALVTGWESFKAALSIFDSIASYFLAFWDPIKKAFTDAWNSIAGATTSIWSKLADTFGIASRAISNVAEEMTHTTATIAEGKPKVEDTAGAVDDLGKKSKETADKFKATKDATAILWAEYQVLQSETKKTETELGKLRAQADLLAFSGKTLADAVTSVYVPMTSTTDATAKLVAQLEKLEAKLPQNTGLIEAMEASLKQLGITSTAVAQAHANQTAAIAAQVTAVGSMATEYDRLMVKQADLKAQIDALSKQDGDHKQKLEDLEAQLKATTKAIGDMGDSTTDTYHKMNLSTTADIEAIMKKDQERVDAATTLAAGGDAAMLRQQQEAEKKLLEDRDKYYGDLTTQQAQRLDELQKELGKHHDTELEQWKKFEASVRGTIDQAFSGFEDLLITGKGSMKEVLTTLWQGLAKDMMDYFLAPAKKAIEDFIANTLKSLMSSLSGVDDSIKNVGADAAKIPSGGGGGTPSVPGGGGEGEAPSVPDEGGGGAGGGILGSSLGGAISVISGAITAISSVIQNFQMAHEIDILKSIEHNTRYTMMYVGERADGGILGVLFKIDEEIAWGANTKATENMRDLFKDWSNPALAFLQGIHDQLDAIAPYISDTKVVLEDIRALAQGLPDVIQHGFDTLNVTVTATGVTTAAAAKALGDQIAANLSRQLVQTS
jgi:hypothetical protein